MRKWIFLAGLVAIMAIVGAALASPGTGVRTVVELATGVAEPGIETHAITAEGARADISLQTKEKTHVVMQEITYGPGATSGWHHHPGVVLAVVKSGQFKLYEDMSLSEGELDQGQEGEQENPGCSVRTLNPGDVFVESGPTPANLRNETASPAVVVITIVAPFRGPPPVLRVEDSVRCG